MITEWRLFKAGHCRHPELAVRRDGGLRPCTFPSLATALRHRRHGWLLLDTGYASHFLTATEPFPERLYRWTTPVHGAREQALAGQLAAAGIDPAQIGHIVLSHLHGDHVAGVADFGGRPRRAVVLFFDPGGRPRRLGLVIISKAP